MAGTTKTHIQLGDSATATNNFMMTAQAADGTMKIARGNNGATTQDILTVDASGKVSLPQGGGSLTLGTLVATTSGGTVTLSSTIPTWAKKIRVLFNGVSNTVSASASDNWVIRGGAGSLETTGYVSGGCYSSSGSSITSNTTGFVIPFGNAANAAATVYGTLDLTLVDTNTWVFSGNLNSDTGWQLVSGGRKVFSGALSLISLVALGAGTFDAGSINVMYEG